MHLLSSDLPTAEDKRISVCLAGYFDITSQYNSQDPNSYELGVDWSSDLHPTS